MNEQMSDRQRVNECLSSRGTLLKMVINLYCNITWLADCSVGVNYVFGQVREHGAYKKLIEIG